MSESTRQFLEDSLYYEDLKTWFNERDISYETLMQIQISRLLNSLSPKE